MFSAILFAVFVNVFIRKNEKDDFENAFLESSTKVFKAIGSSIDQTLIPLDILSVTMVSHAKAVNATWPFVTLPDYALRLSKILPQTDGMIMQSIHLVEPEERNEWEVYTRQNNYWVNESISFQDNWDRYHGDISYDWDGRVVIHSDNGDIPQNIRYAQKASNTLSTNFSNFLISPISRSMAPQWQIFPVSTQVRTCIIFLRGNPHFFSIIFYIVFFFSIIRTIGTGFRKYIRSRSMLQSRVKSLWLPLLF